MLHFRIVVVGKAKSRFAAPEIQEYLKRIQPYAKTELVLVPAVKIPTNPDPAASRQIKDREARLILKALRPDEYLIALDERGQALSSPELARHLDRTATRGRSRLAFVIGGALGLSEQITGQAGLVLSLSRLTFTHELARLVLLEQLYRACRINANEPYHY